MQEIFEATHSERKSYFQEASARSSKIQNPIIIEKDLWVCWILNRIFSNEDLSPHIIFKGGTSLSKCYNVIERFSEDIDLTLSKQYIGISKDDMPNLTMTTKQRDKRLKELTKKVINKIDMHVKPLLIGDFKNHLSTYFEIDEWRLEPDEEDEQNLIFHYPSCFERNADDYIQMVIKLEFGARGENNPCESKKISPYVSQLLPEIIKSPEDALVTTLLAKRTFWEKVTLLHADYHRDINKPLPNRLFRHYYDIVKLDNCKLTTEALQDIDLLEDVVRNKEIYFPSKWANYSQAKIGNLRLYPNELFISHLKQDHKKMTEMFFGEPPDFDQILNEIKRIESVINEIR